MLQKRTARYVQVFGGETEPAQITRFVRAMRMIGVEQVAQELRIFDESVFRIGQLHRFLDKRPILVPKELMGFTMLTIRGFQWRGFDRVRSGGSAGKPALQGREPRPTGGRSGLCIS